MTERELLELDYDDYMMECYRVLNKNKELLDLQPHEISFTEALWVRRYYMYKVGQYEISN